jgi:hypothetical protein
MLETGSGFEFQRIYDEKIDDANKKKGQRGWACPKFPSSFLIWPFFNFRRFRRAHPEMATLD